MRLLKDSSLDTYGIARKTDHILFPDDLREWIDEDLLARMTLTAVEKAVDDLSSVPQRFGAYQSKAILSVLCYCYSIGIYDSQEIHRQIRSNPGVGYLAAQWRPTGDDLRLFRREFRELIESSLRWLALMVFLWKEVHSSAPKFSPNAFLSQLDLTGVMDWRPFQNLREEIYQRIQEAVAEDTMTMDE